MQKRSVLKFVDCWNMKKYIGDPYILSRKHWRDICSSRHSYELQHMFWHASLNLEKSPWGRNVWTNQKRWILTFLTLEFGCCNGQHTCMEYKPRFLLHNLARDEGFFQNIKVQSIIKALPEGRTRGRPTKTYVDCIEEVARKDVIGDV